VPRKEVSVIITGNYSAEAYRLTLPLWGVRVLFGLLALVLLVVVAAVVMVMSGAYGMTRFSYLEMRNRHLEAEFAKVGKLRRQLEELEQQTRSMATMLGIDKTPAPVNWDSAAVDTAALPDWVKAQAWGNTPVPSVLPLAEYAVSRTATSPHMAIDLAARAGTPARATADGWVLGRGTDRTLGRFLLLRHMQGYESYYGHLDDWNVDKGDSVLAGQTVGWVGSTGVSTAPHLHFEIRRDGKPIDPATLLRF
jgi:murein DD-endopeptidase MepM/ murein hydrolase activator NlpD